VGSPPAGAPPVRVIASLLLANLAESLRKAAFIVVEENRICVRRLPFNTRVNRLFEATPASPS